MFFGFDISRDNFGECFLKHPVYGKYYGCYAAFFIGFHQHFASIIRRRQGKVVKSSSLFQSELCIFRGCNDSPEKQCLLYL